MDVFFNYQGTNVKDCKSSCAQKQGASFVEEEVCDTVRKEEAGGSVETAPSQTATDTEAAELRQRAGTWAGRSGDNRWTFNAFFSV